MKHMILESRLNYGSIIQFDNWTGSMFNLIVQSMSQLNKEQSEIREVVLQNQHAVDIELAVKKKRGAGSCALIHAYCCYYISNYQVDVNHTIHLMEKIANRFTDVDISGVFLGIFSWLIAIWWGWPK
uniref:Uncharacterized protein n=1 Tax=Micrurus spixii TaxID=129469 RepID=A0A2D4MXK0_9SAUR